MKGDDLLGKGAIIALIALITGVGLLETPPKPSPPPPKVMEWVEVPDVMEMVVTATAYAEHEDGGITCFGKKIVAGRTLAVDPKEIPFGSKVYFYSTGETYIAEDVGGAIQGLKVDKAMKTTAECIIYGKRKEKIKVTMPTTHYELREM